MNVIYPIVHINTGEVISKASSNDPSACPEGTILIANRSDLGQLATGALLRMYNDLTNGNVKKFSSRDAGERQVMRFLNPTNERSKSQMKSAPKKSTVKKEPVKATPSKAKVHHRIKVGSKEYKSIREAFVDLKLPLNKHAVFRGLLNRTDDGKLSFEWKGKSYLFEHAS